MDRGELGFLSALSAPIGIGILYFLVTAGVELPTGSGRVPEFAALMVLLGVLPPENFLVHLIVGLFRARSHLGTAD